MVIVIEIILVISVIIRESCFFMNDKIFNCLGVGLVVLRIKLWLDVSWWIFFGVGNVVMLVVFVLLLWWFFVVGKLRLRWGRVCCELNFLWKMDLWDGVSDGGFGEWDIVEMRLMLGNLKKRNMKGKSSFREYEVERNWV